MMNSLLLHDELYVFLRHCTLYKFTYLLSVIEFSLLLTVKNRRENIQSHYSVGKVLFIKKGK